ncbi:putative membrane protein [Sphingobium fontiphilum]|uniref:Putative membrane protein n=1 Tax=Sphingobium fontiphilum TaxID=944425 RepID=A0A7W6DNC4_9SPHN|nr:urate hydroxylase PuuD [Sphingobium fontiphilum]MBB3983023.1 putative membrane protein [Sphingobium fontiphilum]
MAKFFGNLHLVLAAGLALALVVMFAAHPGMVDANGVFRWLHLFFGITWIGLLYYFNFVQIPTMPKIPAELKPGVSKHIAPAALFFFRWAALLTVVTGLVVAWLAGYVHQALMLQAPYLLIGIGMWLALIMAANVWFVIWPNQKKALGIVAADDAAKAKAASVAMMASRTNTLLSLAMLYCMVNFS